VSKVRKFRVSVFPNGTTDLGSRPLKHHCCDKLRTAEDHFQRYVVRKERPRVIVHQGNLRDHAYKRILDSYWGEHFSDPREQWQHYIENKRVERGEA
jgi:hypothetical protein